MEEVAVYTIGYHMAFNAVPVGDCFLQPGADADDCPVVFEEQVFILIYKSGRGQAVGLCYPTVVVLQ